jgi:hypothetical protein
MVVPRVMVFGAFERRVVIQYECHVYSQVAGPWWQLDGEVVGMANMAANMSRR